MSPINIIYFVPGTGQKAVSPYGPGGKSRSGVTLAMRRILNWFICIRDQGLRKGHEHPAYQLTLPTPTQRDKTVLSSRVGSGRTLWTGYCTFYLLLAVWLGVCRRKVAWAELTTIAMSSIAAYGISIQTSSVVVLTAQRAASRASCSIQRWTLTVTSCTAKLVSGWLGSRVVYSVPDSGAEGPGFKSQPRRCRVTVLGKLFTPIVPLFTKQRNW